jgi:laminin alpha 3/5
MIVLSQLNELKLRATYYNKLHNSELIDFKMSVAVQYLENMTSIEQQTPSSSAEHCYCPPNFKGYSCESCEDGYYKVKSSGPGLFNCVPCNCSGHADTCDQNTGKCIDCRDNTYGDHCEFCKKSHYQIIYPETGYSECRLCPCPGPIEGNVFADSCKYDLNSNKVYECSCQTGYTGQYCERCAPGYFGVPFLSGGRCSQCQCNNNINMIDYDSCDQRTGMCQKCLNNTAGPSCEKCAEGYYGDAIELKNCQKCKCNTTGSESCDLSTGVCKCKRNVIGNDCSLCPKNTWGFHLGNGCIDCSCDPIGSESAQCNPNNGQCKCKTGVTGQKCDQCLPDHWNFTQNGCQKCECKMDGVLKTETGGFSCNPINGSCVCIEGVRGENCDMCDDKWVLVKHVGCKNCKNNSCVMTLLNELEPLHDKYRRIDEDFVSRSFITKAVLKIEDLENELEIHLTKLDNSIEINSTELFLLRDSLKEALNIFYNLTSLNDEDFESRMKLIRKIYYESEFLLKNLQLQSNGELIEQISYDLENDFEEAKNGFKMSDEDLNKYEYIVASITKKQFNLERNKEVLAEFENRIFFIYRELLVYFNKN